MWSYFGFLLRSIRPPFSESDARWYYIKQSRVSLRMVSYNVVGDRARFYYKGAPSLVLADFPILPLIPSRVVSFESFFDCFDRRIFRERDSPFRTWYAMVGTCVIIFAPTGPVSPITIYLPNGYVAHCIARQSITSSNMKRSKQTHHVGGNKTHWVAK